VGPSRDPIRVAPVLLASGLCAWALLCALGCAPASSAAPPSELEPLPEDAGAALRAAIDARDVGQLERASTWLAEIARRHPLVADHADLLRAEVLVRAGRHPEAAALAETALAGHEGSPVLASLARVLGDARLAEGRTDAARAAWEQALATETDTAARAEIELAIAESLERDGRTADGEALRRLRSVWSGAPLTPAAARAEERLVALEASAAAGRRPLDWADRADALFESNRNEEALSAYRRALGTGEPLLDGPARHAAHRRIAELLFRMRRYAEAQAAFGALPPEPDVELMRARAQARAGDGPGGARALEALAARSSGETAAHARLLAGLLWEGRGEGARARVLFEAVARASDGGAHATAALWRLGWRDFRDGDLASATERFEALRARESHPIDALRARYWQARARLQSGDPSGSAELRAVAEEFPLSYYGMRARDALPPAPALEPRRAVLDPGTRAITARDTQRIAILHAAGLSDWTRRELEGLRSRAAGIDDRLALARLAADVGLPDRAQRIILEAYADTLPLLPEPGREELWQLAHPRPFAADVEGQAKRGGASAALVYAIMREESGYRPDVVSTAGARGLLQLMPETAGRVAARIGLSPFDPDDLFSPAVNVRLGAAYLEELVGRFEGRLSAAIASYNAGPEAVASWLAQGGVPDDEWVETIPYDQTHQYVKRVLRTLHAYRTLYGMSE
jgi:soluble lytic murein transglycosylase